MIKHISACAATLKIGWDRNYYELKTFYNLGKMLIRQRGLSVPLFSFGILYKTNFLVALLMCAVCDQK